MANALQRKVNKTDLDPTIKRIESALLLNTTGNGQTIFDRLKDLETALYDAKTHQDLAFDEKLSKRIN